MSPNECNVVNQQIARDAVQFATELEATNSHALPAGNTGAFMSRSKKYMAAAILSASMLFTSAARAQTATPQNNTPYQRPCSLLTKAEAEFIVGASLVVHRDNNEECWYVED